MKEEYEEKELENQISATANSFSGFITKSLNILRWVQVLCLVATTTLVFGQILFREIFNIGVPWIFEIACFFQVSMVYLGVPILLYNKENIRITFLLELFPDKFRHYLMIFEFVIEILATFLLSLSFTLFTYKFWDMSSATLRLPNFVFFSSIAIGLFFSILVLLDRFIRRDFGLGSEEV